MTSQEQLLAAVAGFLREDLQPVLAGVTAYHNRIASNLLGVLQRELQYGDSLAALDNAFLSACRCASDGSLADLSRALRDGSVPSDLALDAYLKRRTLLRLAIDNPRYSGYGQAREAWPEMAVEMDALLQSRT